MKINYDERKKKLTENEIGTETMKSKRRRRRKKCARNNKHNENENDKLKISRDALGMHTFYFLFYVPKTSKNSVNKE